MTCPRSQGAREAEQMKIQSQRASLLHLQLLPGFSVFPSWCSGGTTKAHPTVPCPYKCLLSQFLPVSPHPFPPTPPWLLSFKLPGPPSAAFQLDQGLLSPHPEGRGTLTCRRLSCCFWLRKHKGCASHSPGLLRAHKVQLHRPP